MPNQPQGRFPVAEARASSFVKAYLEELNQTQTVSSSAFAEPTPLPTKMSEGPHTTDAGLGITTLSSPEPAAPAAVEQQPQQQVQPSAVYGQLRMTTPAITALRNTTASPAVRSDTPSTTSTSRGNTASPASISGYSDSDGSDHVIPLVNFSHYLTDPITTAHALRRAEMQPHERLYEDIARLPSNTNNEAPTSYTTPPERGPHPQDITSHVPSQTYVSERNLPIGLGMLEQPLYIPAYDVSLQVLPLLRNKTNNTVQTGALGQPLYDLPILPDAISTAVEAWRVAMWLCYDARATLHDVSARMKFINTPEALAAVERDLGARVVEWCETNAGMVFHRRAGENHCGVGERDVRLVGELGMERVRRNCVWDMWRGWGAAAEDADGRRRLFVTQPGGNEYGAMWPAAERIEGGVHGVRTMWALWEYERRQEEERQAEKRRAGGRTTGVMYPQRARLAMEVREEWLLGADVQRERPSEADVLAMGVGDVKWVLKRWNVVPAAMSPSTASGDHSSYQQTASPVGFHNPYAQPAKSPNPGHASIGGLIQQPGVAGNVGSAQSASQDVLQSGPQIPTSAYFQPSFSNIHLPNTAQRQHQLYNSPALTSTDSQGDANSPKENPAAVPQGAAAPAASQQPSSVSTPLMQHASPSTTSPAPELLAFYRDRYSQTDTQELVKEHADAPRSLKDILWHLIHERRHQFWENERSKS
ncbi:hypothetical protein SLS55_003494 [Diplodia seriata]|uniref:Uncharacterized protein n=1 Tax=Diplodia seriata TaxID=420778 RepID=A0ABR3CRE1_9PEZI